jgi:hypothetical protein
LLDPSESVKPQISGERIVAVLCYVVCFELSADYDNLPSDGNGIGPGIDQVEPAYQPSREVAEMLAEKRPQLRF